MLKENPFANPMLQRQSFDDFYAKKLDVLKVELKAIIKGDTPFIVSDQYSCHTCSGRIKVHSQGKVYCLLCGEMPQWWSKELKASVSEIMLIYPGLAESRREWQTAMSLPMQATTPKPTPRADIVLGKKIREARQAQGLSQEDLAAQITKPDGNPLSAYTIRSYENGWSAPSQHALKQLKNILQLEGI